MEWLSQDFQGLYFETRAINKTSSSWGLTRRTKQALRGRSATPRTPRSKCRKMMMKIVVIAQKGQKN